MAFRKTVRAVFQRSSSRLLAGASLLLVEYLLLSLSVDAKTISERNQAFSVFRYAGQLGPLVPLIPVGWVVLWAAAPAAWAAAFAGLLRDKVSRRWLALQVTLFAMLLGLSVQVAYGPVLPQAYAVVVAWALLALACGATLLLSLVDGRRLLALARIHASWLVLIVSVGGLAWVAGWAATLLWPWLGAATIFAVELGLRALAHDVLRPTPLEIGADGFLVEVAPECSGFEGMGLVCVFLLVFLGAARSRLRFPRAWLLLALGIAASWLANVVRIIALMEVGLYVDEDLALGAFHSKAGWILFCAVTLGTVALGLRSPWFANAREPIARPIAGESHSDLFLSPSEIVVSDNPPATYLVPFLLVLSGSLVTSAFSEGLNSLYAVSVVLGAFGLLGVRRAFRPLEFKALGLGVVVGVLVTPLWVLLLPPVDAHRITEFRVGLSELNELERAFWWASRLVGTALVVPIVEELAFRGYLMRRLMHSEFERVAYARCSPLSIGASAVVFGVLHDAWIGGIVAGLAYGVVARRANHLSSAIVAHGVTNALLATAALSFDRLEWIL